MTDAAAARSRTLVGRRAFLSTLALGAGGMLLCRPQGARAQLVDPSATFAEFCAALPPGHWAKANVNTFQSVWPPMLYAPPSAQGNPRSIIRAWAASAFDGERGDWYFWGGGHANYNGNEMYRFRTDTRRWERCSLPSHTTQVATGIYEATVGGVYSAPIASHCYDTMNYLPGLGRIFVGGGAMFGVSGVWRRPYPSSEKTGPYLWDLSKADPLAAGGLNGSNWYNGQVGFNPGLNAWDNRDTYQSRAGRPLGAPNGFSESTVEGGKDVVYIGWGSGTGVAGSVYRYEFGATAADDHITQVGKIGQVTPDQGAAAWDPTRRHFVVIRGNVNGSNRSVLLYNVALSTPTSPVRALTIRIEDQEGYFSTRNWRNMGIRYDIGRDLYWLWDGEQSVYALTPGSSDGLVGWTVARALDPESVEYPQVSAEIPIFNGTLGKWVYDPRYDVFMGCYHYLTGDIWVYKPPVA